MLPGREKAYRSDPREEEAAGPCRYGLDERRAGLSVYKVLAVAPFEVQSIAVSTIGLEHDLNSVEHNVSNMASASPYPAVFPLDRKSSFLSDRAIGFKSGGSLDGDEGPEIDCGRSDDADTDDELPRIEDFFSRKPEKVVIDLTGSNDEVGAFAVPGSRDRRLTRCGPQKPTALDIAAAKRFCASQRVYPLECLWPHISSAHHFTSSTSSPAVSETPTLEPGLCLPVLPSIHSAEHVSTISPTQPGVVQSLRPTQPAASPRPKKSPFISKPAWALRPLREVAPPGETLSAAATPLLHQVDESVGDNALKRNGTAQPALQDGLHRTRSPCGTLKRPSATSGRLAPDAGVFTYDVSGEDDDENSGVKRARHVDSPLLQIEDEASATASQEGTHGDSDGCQVLVGGQDIRVGSSSVGRGGVSLQDGWQVDRILEESRSGLDFKVVVTRTVWLPKADLGRMALRRYRAEQRRAVPARQSARLRGQRLA